MPESNELSERELEILGLLATGASNKEIAQKLFISANTVKVHLRNIFTKIDVTSRTEAAMYAVGNGLVPGINPSAEDGLLARANEAGATEPASMLARLPGSNWGLIAVLVLLVVGLFGAALFLSRDPSGQASAVVPTATNLPRWKNLADMPTARYGFGLTVYESQIYAVGGELETGVSNSVERYDPKTNLWVKLQSKPTAVGEVKAAVIGGRIFVPGGKLASGGVSDKLEIFDPQQDTWLQGASLPVAVSAYALVAYEGRLYVFGGWDGRQYSNHVFEYDPGQDRWNSMPDMPTARAFAGAAVAGEKIYVIGGKNDSGPLTVNEVYQPDRESSQAGAWNEVAPLPSGRFGMGVASVADIIHIVGGQGTGNEALSTLEYLPSSDLWKEFESSLSQPVTYLGVVPLNLSYMQWGDRSMEFPASGTRRIRRCLRSRCH